MQLKMSALAVVFAFVLLQGCRVSTQIPLKAEDIRICGDAAKVVADVRRISADQNLSFHYGTHPTDYGTQTTFRLVGSGYEIEFFNSMSQSDYTLRVYKASSGEGAEQEAEQAFDQFKEMLVKVTEGNC